MPWLTLRLHSTVEDESLTFTKNEMILITSWIFKTCYLVMELVEENTWLSIITWHTLTIINNNTNHTILLWSIKLQKLCSLQFWLTGNSVTMSVYEFERMLGEEIIPQHTQEVSMSVGWDTTCQSVTYGVVMTVTSHSILWLKKVSRIWNKPLTSKVRSLTIFI